MLYWIDILGHRLHRHDPKRGLDESWSPWDTYYRPAVYERLGRMAEEDGRTEEALRYYSRLIDLWRDADQEIVVMRQEIEERVDLLLPD